MCYQSPQSSWSSLSSETSRSFGTIQTSQSSIGSHPAFPDIVCSQSWTHPDTPAACKGAAQAITSLIKGSAIKALSPSLLPMKMVSETLTDKMPSPCNTLLEAVWTITLNMASWATRTILLALLKTAGKCQVKSGSLSIIDGFIIFVNLDDDICRPLAVLQLPV